MSSLKILHLSDLHIGNFKYVDPNVLPIKICDLLHEQSKKVDLVVVSGDIFDGNSEKAVEDQIFATLFFKTLVDQLLSKGISPASFSIDNILFVPGNHDLVRKKGFEFEKYNSFINTLYPKGRLSRNLSLSDEFNFYYVHPESKVIIVGFNSCKIETEKIKADELKWIDELDLSIFSDETEIKSKIKEIK